MTKYYYFGATRVAMRKGAEVYYLHGDHLGSTSLTTDATGGIVAQSRYLPYGQERWITGTVTTDFGFTGQRNERGFGLMDYNARYYDPALGRFASADTVVPQAGNPQAWNRYAYVANNPLKFSDTSGHCWGIASGLRNTVYGQTCENLDLAGIIATSPDATAGQKFAARGYISIVAAAHIGLAIGGGILACSSVAPCATALGITTTGAEQTIEQTTQAANTTLAEQAAAIPSGPPVALGLSTVDKQSLLFNFARDVVPGSEVSSQWYDSGLTTIDPSSGNWQGRFEEAMNNTSHINFNLTGIKDIGEALEKGSHGWYAMPDNITNTELYNIVNNPDWFAKSTFYLNGNPQSAEEVTKLFGGH